MAGGISKWNGDAVNAAAARETVRILTEASRLVLREVQESMRQDKTGIVYKKANTKATWQASAPGEAPSARHTGNLLASMDFDVGEENGILIGRVGTLGEGKTGMPTYAAMLELGTVNMAPRPYLVPALEAKAAEIRALFDSRKL